MNKVIGVRELQERLDSVFDDVAESRVLVRFDWALARLAERNAAFSDEEIAADVAAARREC